MPAPPAPSAVVVIPARLGSTRFAGKVLADRTGRPLIRHVYENALRAACASRVVVATDHPRVRDAVVAFGGECVMTSPDHPSGTSRVAEAAAILGVAGGEVVVNIQGDEPELEPSLVDAAVGALGDGGPGDAPVSTAAVPLAPGEDAGDPNVVKVVLRGDGRAMYFSRAAIPFVRDAGGRAVEPLRHLGVYAYRRWFLDRYVSLAPTELEQTEQLEQLRVLYHGFEIAVAVRHVSSGGGIDTPEQYDAFVRRWHGSR